MGSKFGLVYVQASLSSWQSDLFEVGIHIVDERPDFSRKVVSGLIVDHHWWQLGRVLLEQWYEQT
jgi:hypothetical protein